MTANACNKQFVCPEDDEKCRCTRREGHDGSCAQVRLLQAYCQHPTQNNGRCAMCRKLLEKDNG